MRTVYEYERRSNGYVIVCPLNILIDFWLDTFKFITKINSVAINWVDGGCVKIFELI